VITKAVGYDPQNAARLPVADAGDSFPTIVNLMSGPPGHAEKGNR
jgi:hypothetical protein